ncbi:hypothetical protein HL273_20285 [Yersinia enterocolitica]|uniref:hypothetical protein n=1 Tax=Yersinia enterocolitica TaxID=630 RepID=UPI00155AEA6E|nr:hypothetical protein [Yersinia enterocolitica]MBX9483900.1 hypothetical protein [Yersinia enterocolitica]NQS96556.1 hypothetical protein [Yersinia enterocolitica]NQT45609.1 hypothetical protein [Yersinia enterocolitica]NQU02364.1 hypothetical protein [Yersinia enterocolitica]
MQYSNGWKLFYDAVNHLAGADSQRERLLNAFVYSLSHIKPEIDLPENLRTRFTKLTTLLNNKPASGSEGTAQATIFTLDESELRQAVESIIDIYDSLCREMPKE